MKTKYLAVHCYSPTLSHLYSSPFFFPFIGSKRFVVVLRNSKMCVCLHTFRHAVRQTFVQCKRYTCTKRIIIITIINEWSCVWTRFHSKIYYTRWNHLFLFEFSSFFFFFLFPLFVALTSFDSRKFPADSIESQLNEHKCDACRTQHLFNLSANWK